MPKRSYQKATCVFCERVFSSIQNLEEHIHTHTEERPHHCPKCDLWYRSFSNCWDHRRVVHLGLKYTCNVCGQEFNALSNMCNHRRRMHGVGGGGVRNITPKAVRMKNVTPKVKTVKRKKIPEILVKVEAPEKKKRKLSEKKPATKVKMTQLKRKGREPAKNLRQNWKTFKCKLCGRLFHRDRFSLKRHMRRVHQQELEEDDKLTVQKTSANQAPLNPAAYQFFAKYHNVFAALNSPLTALKLHNEPVMAPPRSWDPSFFLHMNRYKPDEEERPCDPFKPAAAPVTPAPAIVQVKTEPRENVEKKNAMLLKQMKTPVVLIEKLVIDVKPQRSIKTEPTEMESEADEAVNYDNEVKPSVDEVPLSNDTEEQIDIKYELEPISEPFQCKKCGKVLANKFTFQRHQGITNCIKPPPIASFLYFCPFCKRDFGIRRSNMIRHIATTHRYQQDEESINQLNEVNAGRRKYSDYSCGFCGLTCNRKEDLQEHILVLHNEML